MSVTSSTSVPTLTVGDNGKVTAGNLVNNLDTTAIINALMGAAAIPQTQLKSKVTTEQSTLTQYQNLNQSLQALAKAATTDSAANGLNLLAVTSSDPSVSGTASTTAHATQLTLQVDQVAQSQVSVSAPMTTWPDSSGAITIVSADGTATEVDAASDSVDDVVSAINSAGLGVTATSVAIGTDVSGATQYRVQLTATQSGSDGAFQVYAGTASAYAAGTATDLLTQTGAATVSTAQDAQVTLWPGTAASQTISSASNTFNNIEQGMTVTVTNPTTGTVTLNSALDTSSVENAASTLVSAVNTLLSFIGTQSAGTTSTDSAGNTSVTPGAFSGDFAIRQVASQLTNAVTSPVGDGTVSPSTYGISIQQDGSFNFDKAAFESALASNPAGTLAAVQQIASRVAAAANQASDPTTGSVTSSITTQQTQISADQKSITNWDTVLASKKTQLQAKYANLVTMLGQLQSEQQYLTQQITAMNQPNN